MIRTSIRALVVVAALGLPSTVFGQAAITGIVTDESGAVLPGVTVEARSPALIERVRSTVTDSSGRYRIIELPHGAYDVTFTLQSFATVKRTGLELEGTFTATVNLTMKVGGIEQVVTISAETPTVNISSAKQEDVLRREEMAALPIARDWFSIATLVPGMVLGGSQDIGGLASTKGIVQTPFAVHGGASAGRGTEGRLMVDGLSTGASALFGTGSGAYMPDITNAQEVSVLSSGGLGSTETGGPVINVIPRSGGNTWAAQTYYNYSTDNWQDRNITAEQKAENPGLAASISVLKAQDVNISGGGPIMKDRAWFWAVGRWNMLDQRNGFFFNLNAGDATKWTYQKGDAAYDDTRFRQYTARVTWQATQRDKITGSIDRSYKEVFYTGGGGLGVPLCATYCSPEAGITSDARPQSLPQVSWQRPHSDRLLFDAAFSWYYAHTGGQARPGTPRDLIGVRDLEATVPGYDGTIDVSYRSMVQIGDNVYSAPRWRAAVSYMRWGHNLRLGHDGIYFTEQFRNWTNDESINYTLRRGVPESFNVRAVNGFSAPAENWTQNQAIYIEDSWTHNRLTLQGALRFDYATSGNPEITYGPGKYFVLTPVILPERTSVAGYKDFTPRMSAAYDLFGNGKTALKFNVGEYLQEASNGGNYNANNVAAQLNNNAYTGSGNRAWTDNDTDFAIDCDITNGTAQGPSGVGVLNTVDTCGAVTIAALGTPTTSTNTVDPNLLKGWNVRPNDYQIGLAVQQEILPRLSIEVGYRRRWFGNFSFTNNYGGTSMGADCGPTGRDCVTSDTYERYSLPVPVAPDLPGGGGYVIDDLYDPRVLISTASYTTRETEANRRTVRWHGYDVNVTARMRSGLILRGGWVQASTLTDTCKTVVDNPEGLRTCRSITPWAVNAKFSASYTTPRIFDSPLLEDFTTAVVVNARPLTTLAANWQIRNTYIRDSSTLGRLPTGALANGTTTKNVLPTEDLINQDFLDTQWNADLRVSRIFRFAHRRLDVGVDVFNFLNLSSVTSRDLTLNADTALWVNWQRPLTVETARFAKFYVQFDF